MGRILKAICADIRKGKSLYAACQNANWTSAEFYKKIAKSPTDREEYFLALADYADACTDEIKAIVEDLKHGVIDNPTAKLLIDTEKWLVQRFDSDDFKTEHLTPAVSEVAEIAVRFIDKDDHK